MWNHLEYRCSIERAWKKYPQSLYTTLAFDFLARITMETKRFQTLECKKRQTQLRCERFPDLLWMFRWWSRGRTSQSEHSKWLRCHLGNFLRASRLFSRFFSSKSVASGNTAFLRGSRVHCFVLSLRRAPPTVEKLRARPRAVGRKS